ncbi:hypothetical protein ACE6H2_003212 [Prunus campanulata]
MNPAKLQLDEDRQHSVTRDQMMMMNGNRPSPLKINKASYLIQKPPNNNNSSSRMANQQHPHEHQQHHQQQRQPVIIYTQSPKIIHTQARDFMALVQKLTGLDQTQQPESSTTTDDHVHVKVDASSLSQGRRNQDDQIIDINNINSTASNSIISSCSHDDNDQSSSGLTDENCDNNNNKNVDVVHHQGNKGSSSSSCGYYPPNAMFSHPSQPYFADIPLFTPTSTSSTDFFCSPRPLYRFSDSSSNASPNVNVGGSISPSMFKFIKGLTEY